ncbi:MAG: flagellin FliC [Magnetococcales bacterium]|nr:flagellin FliC [Magnetococcales bacterium]
MALSINTNLSSIFAQNKLTKSTNQLGKTFERLSSGLRINKSSDDAAGMSISTRMSAQVRGVNQAIRNTNDAISAVQVAEGALNETTSALQRIRELTVQAASDTSYSTDRSDIQKELNQMVYEIQRIATQTTFNKQKVLNGSYLGKKFQVGADGAQTITMSILNTSVVKLGINSTTVKVFSAGQTAAKLQSMANSLIAVVDRALDSVSDIRATLGAYQNRFEAVIANLSNMSENTTAARSRIVDADIATETANLTRNSILQQAGTAILAQANQQPQIALKLLQ